MTATSGTSNSRAPFPTTSWTMIRALQALSAPQRQSFYEEWLRYYWKPLYSYFLVSCRDPHEAADMVQGFLCGFLEQDKLLKLNRQESRFRDWLLTCAENYFHSEYRRARAAKRRPAEGLVRLDALRSADGEPYEPQARGTARDAFLDAWRRDLLARALSAVWDECVHRDRQVDYRLFADYYLATADEETTWQILASRHGVGTAKDATRKADWVKGRLQRAILGEIRRYAVDDQAAQDELDDLLR